MYKQQIEHFAEIIVSLTKLLNHQPCNLIDNLTIWMTTSQFDWQPHWLTAHWLTTSLTDNLTDWQPHWLTTLQFDWPHWLTASLTDNLTDWQPHSLIDNLTDWQPHSLIDCLTDWQPQFDWQPHSLIDSLTLDLLTASMLAELLSSFWVWFSSRSWILLSCSSTAWYLLCSSMLFSRSWLHFSLYLSISMCSLVFSSSMLFLVCDQKWQNEPINTWTHLAFSK